MNAVVRMKILVSVERDATVDRQEEMTDDG